jgi:hypothetical protein
VQSADFLRVLLTSLVLLALTNSPSAQDAPRPDADPRIEKLVAAISEERLRQIEEKLTSFGTRHTLSDTNSPSRGIGAARQWIFDELRRSHDRNNHGGRLRPFISCHYGKSFLES